MSNSRCSALHESPLALGRTTLFALPLNSGNPVDCLGESEKDPIELLVSVEDKGTDEILTG